MLWDFHCILCFNWKFDDNCGILLGWKFKKEKKFIYVRISFCKYFKEFAWIAIINIGEKILTPQIFNPPKKILFKIYFGIPYGKLRLCLLELSTVLFTRMLANYVVAAIACDRYLVRECPKLRHLQKNLWMNALIFLSHIFFI